MAGELLREGLRRDQANKATLHVLSPVMENVSPLNLKTEQGANLQRQQTG